MNLLFRYIKQYKKLLALSLFLASINQIFSLLDPQIFRLLIDNYASKYQTLTAKDYFNGILLLTLASMGTALVSRIAKNFQDYYVNVITQRLGSKLYSDSVSHAFSLPYIAFEDQRSGELLQKLQKARSDSQALVTQSVNTLFLSVLGVLVVLVYAFFVNWIIGLVYVSIIPTLGLITFKISSKIKEAQKNIITESSALAGNTTETIRNVELVKSLGLEHQELGRLEEVNQSILKLELKKVKLVRSLSFLQGTTINTLRSGLTLLMLYLIQTGDITLGQFFSLLFYSFAVFNPLSELATVATVYQEAKASLEKLDEVFSKKSEPKPENPKPLSSISEFSFNNASFKYDGSIDSALTEVSLHAKSGETIALVGTTGSGKSTVIKLLLGLYKPNSGSVLINNIALADLDQENFRAKIGLVAQETQLFSGTIRENLLFVKPTATDEECLNALKAAAAESILERTSEGLESKIGEGGLKLSGGEKQRLAIARALLRNPDLLVFDEATSALDSLTEKEITETIKGIKKHKPDLITVQVAHRLSTIIHSDKIYVLEKGKIIEQGNSEELINQKGLFYALWRGQQSE